MCRSIHRSKIAEPIEAGLLDVANFAAISTGRFSGGREAVENGDVKTVPGASLKT